MRLTSLDHEKMLLVNLRSKYLYLFLTLLLIMAGMAASSAHARPASKSDEAAGAVLFRDKGCAYCHGPGGSGGKKGPNLSGIRTDKLWPPAKMTTQILNGGQKMPPFADSLTDAEIAQLVAYLRAKQRPVPPPLATPPPPPPAPAD
jgi:mono/diheme cytochrome c family protein